MPPKIYKLIAAVLAVALLFVLLSNGCGKQNTEEAGQLTAARDSIMAYQVEAAASQVRQNQMQANIDALVRDTAEMKAEIRKRDASLTSAQRRAVGLSADLASARARRDTVGYKAAADSLQAATVALSEEVDSFRVVTHQLSVQLEKILRENNEVVQNLSRRLLSCESAVRVADTAIRKAIPVVKPRSAVYVGGALYGNKETPVAGYTVDGQLVNKRGQAFQIGAGHINGAFQVKGGMLFRLSFKKR